MPIPNITDGPQLVGLTIVAAALGLMAFARAGRVDWIARIDAAIVGLGVGVVVAVFLWPETVDADLTGEGVVVSGLSLAVLTVLVAVSVRLALTAASRSAAGRFLVEGSVLLAVGLALVRSGQLQFTDVELDRMGLSLGVVGPLLLAGAAIHPSAARVTDREHQPAHAMSRLRLVLLVAAASAGPLSAVVQQVRGDAVNGLLIGASSTLLVFLLVARLQLVVQAGQVQADREVTVREAAMSLGGARDLPTIRSQTLAAAADLLGDDLRYVAWIVMNDRGAVSPLEIVGPAGHLERVEAGIDDALVRLDGIGDLGVRVLDSTGTEVLIAPVPSRLAVRAAIAVAAGRRVPDEVDESLAILSTQCASALDALVQTEELHEKRSEARFRQLVRHSSDAVLIVGQDGTHPVPDAVGGTGARVPHRRPRRRRGPSASSTPTISTTCRASSTSSCTLPPRPSARSRSSWCGLTTP